MLQQELPEALVLWEKRPRIVVPQMHWALAALAGIGAQWLSLAVIRGTLFATASLSGFPQVRTLEITEAISWAIAAVIAFASAGRRGLVALIALASAVEGTQLLLAWPSAMLFCEQSGLIDCPTDPLRLALRSWPIPLGLAVGFLARRAASRGPDGIYALPLGASVVVLTILVAQVLIAYASGPGRVQPRTLLEPFLAAQAVAALGMGVVAGRWSHRSVMAGVLMSAAYLLSWLPYFIDLLRQRTPLPFPIEAMWQTMTPAFFAAAALVGLVVGVVMRRRALAGAGSNA